jgi:hypothetical protein
MDIAPATAVPVFGSRPHSRSYVAPYAHPSQASVHAVGEMVLGLPIP